jgi:hypothetical protein
MLEADNLNRLPPELDNESVIFAYGSLLDHAQLCKLLKHRGGFRIFETNDLAEAGSLVVNKPKDIVILRNVRLENVRVAIVTETMLRRWYKNRGGEIEELIRLGVTKPEVPRALFLYARPSGTFEKGRSLNGGLIFNFTKDELARLDKYEFDPVLVRSRTPELRIGGRSFFPEAITFYAGTESYDDMTAEERTERARLLHFNRKAGQLSPQARWRKDVRRR